MQRLPRIVSFYIVTCIPLLDRALMLYELNFAADLSLWHVGISYCYAFEIDRCQRFFLLS